ncbi:hypothetical protein GGR17_003832, partial [Confluentimicrobium naphthalenivorans]|nr:hypothetical protein [Actibacterium naphthalenivorans]
ARTNPAIPITCVPDAGHMIPWDNEKGFFRVLKKLLPSS